MKGSSFDESDNLSNFPGKQISSIFKNFDNPTSARIMRTSSYDDNENLKSNPFKQDPFTRRESFSKVKLSDIHNKIEEADEFEPEESQNKGKIRLDDYVSSNYKSTKADKYEVSSPIYSDSENEDEPLRKDTIASRFLATIELSNEDQSSMDDDDTAINKFSFKLDRYYDYCMIQEDSRESTEEFTVNPTSNFVRPL